MDRPLLPYGNWKSPLTGQRLAVGAAQLSQLSIRRGRIWWIETRPREGGRSVLLSRPLDGGAPREEIPSSMSARNRVNEYGSGAYCVGRHAVWFTHDGDQRIYRADRGGAVPITPAFPDRTVRYCDLQLGPGERWIVCQREQHLDGGRRVVNELVIVPSDGSPEVRVLQAGRDFYGALRLSPDGVSLAFTAWDHPHMPWDGSELHLATPSAEGSCAGTRRIAGGRTISVVHPSWSPEGRLHFASDESGWWNLYSLDEGRNVPRCLMAADFGAAPWTHWNSMHAHLRDRTLLCVYIQEGREILGILPPGSTTPRELDLPFTSFGSGGELCSDGSQVAAAIVSSPTSPEAICVLHPFLGSWEIAYRPGGTELDPAGGSTPRFLSFPTGGGERAHAFHYPPASVRAQGPQGERPPLIVTCHGGPTSAATRGWNPKAQFWATRGFAVLDVDYRGSTGYGRAYRQAINGRSGIVEPEDCLAGARHLAREGRVDPERMAIRGTSAGGYVVLCCAVFRDRLERELSAGPFFSAGVSLYGIADLEALVRTTHKFESHYPFTLIAPYPEGRQVFRERSPLPFVRRAEFPLLLMQGAEDPVVPLEQARKMVSALREAGRPFAYLQFEGEGHGFRRAGTIVRALGAELSFYARIFHLHPPGADDSLVIQNLGTD